MNLGLYQLKYPARKLIEGVLPFFREVSPNTVSLSMLPVGLGIAFCCYFGLNGFPILLLVGIALTLLRMFLGTLDGLIAVRFNKDSPEGEIVNRLIPEICDSFYLAAILFAKTEWYFVGIFALVMSWLTSFSGLVGVLVGKPIQSVGPVGQTDRLAAFMIFACLEFFSMKHDWQIDFIKIFLYWCVCGGLITVFLRLLRTLKKGSECHLKN